MDPEAELNLERERVRRLEEELAFWQNKAIGTIPPETLASVIQRQQMETLTYHLLKQRKMAEEAASKLKAKEKEHAFAVENIRNLERQTEEQARELAKFAKSTAETQTVRETKETAAAGQRFGMSGIPSDEDLDMLFATVPQAKQPVQQQAPKRREPKTVKDFIQLIRRMQRVKVYDAALLLDVQPEQVLAWGDALEKRGYVIVEGLRDKTIVASEKMIRGI